MPQIRENGLGRSSDPISQNSSGDLQKQLQRPNSVTTPSDCKSGQNSVSTCGNLSTCGVVDIRSTQSYPAALPEKCIEGLCQPRGLKFLPSILLWDSKGQSLYHEILSTPYYYPFRVEFELLEREAHSIATRIAAVGNGVLVELGAGNMLKTAVILSALDTLGSQMTYYALDVDEGELMACLASLKSRTTLRNVAVHGLLGTYENGADWLSHAEATRGKRQILLWLGGSFANLQPLEVDTLLRAFTKHHTSQTLAGVILGIDGCTDEVLIKRAYDVPGGQTRRWIKHVLEAGRASLGSEAAELLDDDNWRFEGKWDHENRRFENCLQAAKTMSCKIGGQAIAIERGERVHVLSSRKWTEEDLCSIAQQNGLEIAEFWRSWEVDYGIYWLKLNKHRDTLASEER